VLSDGGDTTDRRFIRSELMRTARSAADEVQLLIRRRRQRLAPTAAPTPTPAQLAAPNPAAPGAPAAVPVPAPGPVPTPVPGPVVASVPPMSPTAPVSAPAYGQQPYGQQPYGESAYGPGEGEQPSYTPPVITTGPVAPLAGLAPQPAAPAPFPAHVQAHVQAHVRSPRPAEEDEQYPLQQPIVNDRQMDGRPYPHTAGEVLRAR
jgi:hypothetical protein